MVMLSARMAIHRRSSQFWFFSPWGTCWSLKKRPHEDETTTKRRTSSGPEKNTYRLQLKIHVIIKWVARSILGWLSMSSGLAEWFHGCSGVWGEWAVWAYMYALEIAGDRAQWVTNYRFVSVYVSVCVHRLVLEQQTGSRLWISLVEVLGDRLWCNRSEGPLLTFGQCGNWH